MCLGKNVGRRSSDKNVGRTSWVEIFGENLGRKSWAKILAEIVDGNFGWNFWAEIWAEIVNGNFGWKYWAEILGEMIHMTHGLGRHTHSACNDEKFAPQEQKHVCKDSEQHSAALLCTTRYQENGNTSVTNLRNGPIQHCFTI